MFQSSKKKLSKANANSLPTINLSGTARPSSSSAPNTPNATTNTNPAFPPILQDGLPLPKLIVFDLDYTLWPFWVDTHVMPPLKTANRVVVTDRIGEEFQFYHQVPSILWCLSQAGVKLGVASRTHAPDLGREMLKLIHVGPPVDENGISMSLGKKDKPRRAIEFFDHLEIYPASKIKHFESLGKRTGIPHSEMLFFDDESRNREVANLGVTFWLVRDGTDWEEVEKGILQWRQNNQRS